MTDIFGPSLIAGGTSVRPGETRAFQALDTFFKDCSDPAIDDGTQLQAAFFNAVLASLRQVARGNGNTATASPIVADDNGNDAILLNAILHIQQRGLTNDALDTGSADAMVVSLSPALAEYKLGTAPIRIKKGAAANATATPTINVNGLGPVTIVQLDGTAIEIGQLGAASLFSVQHDGTNMRLVSPPPSATVAEAELGLLFRKYISPATLLQRRTPYFVLNDAGGATAIPNATNTNLTHLTADAGKYLNDASSSIATSKFTCGLRDAGIWLLGAFYGIASAAAGQFNAAVAINGIGSPFQAGYNPGATYGFMSTRIARLEATDVVQVQAFQNTGGALNAQSGQLFGIRIGG